MIADHPPCGYDSTGFPARADDRPLSTHLPPEGAPVLVWLCARDGHMTGIDGRCDYCGERT